MAFIYDKLLGKIIEVFHTQERFAAAMGMSPQTLSCKLNNKSDWKGAEIAKAMKLLSVEAAQLSEYFFTTEIKKS